MNPVNILNILDNGAPSVGTECKIQGVAGVLRFKPKHFSQFQNVFMLEKEECIY